MTAPTFGTNDIDGNPADESLLRRRARETAARAGSAVRDRAATGADAGLGKAATGIGTAADRMRARAEDDGGVRAAFEGKAAQAMDHTAGYLHSHDSQGLTHDLGEWVRAHPFQAVAVAFFVGYLFKKFFR